jgi:hypothetical protein
MTPVDISGMFLLGMLSERTNHQGALFGKERALFGKEKGAPPTKRIAMMTMIIQLTQPSDLCRNVGTEACLGKR